MKETIDKAIKSQQEQNKDYEEQEGMGTQGPSKADFVGTSRILKGNLEKGGINLEGNIQSEPLEWEKIQDENLEVEIQSRGEPVERVQKKKILISDRKTDNSKELKQQNKTPT